MYYLTTKIYQHPLVHQYMQDTYQTRLFGARFENIVFTLVPDSDAIRDTSAHRSLLVDLVQGKTLVPHRRTSTCHHLES